jgi:hypothetical protein
MTDIDPIAWQLESEFIGCGLGSEVFELVDCVELPAELTAHAEAASQDTDFDGTWDDWLGYLSAHDLLLPIEQSCDSTGLLLPWELRCLRLQTLPADLAFPLAVFLKECPRHARALLIHHVFWLVRFERVRRQGTPTLNLRALALPDDDAPAFFRPPVLTLRNYGR